MGLSFPPDCTLLSLLCWFWKDRGSTQGPGREEDLLLSERPSGSLDEECSPTATEATKLQKIFSSQKNWVMWEPTLLKRENQ